jgi:hypothetical protein
VPLAAEAADAADAGGDGRGARLSSRANGGFFDGSGRNKDITYADVTVRLQW